MLSVCTKLNLRWKCECLLMHNRIQSPLKFHWRCLSTMRRPNRIRLGFKLKCVAVLLFSLAIFALITLKVNFSTARNEVQPFLLAEDEVIYVDVANTKRYYATFSDVVEDGEVRYEDCGDSKKLVALRYFESQPKLLSVPQNLSLSIAFEIIEDLTRHLKISISILRKLPIIGYVRLPCIANYGSCVYDQICHTYEDCPEGSFAYNVICPKWFKATGIECKCPFKKGIYSAKGVPAYISSSLVPRWIVRGDYSAHLTFEDTTNAGDGNRTLGCFKFMFRLT